MITEYQLLVNGEDWSNIRNRIIEKRGLECEKCHTKMMKKDARLKNKNKNIKNKTDEDLMLVCDKCHYSMHKDVHIPKR